MFYNAKEKLLEIQDIQMNYITFGKGEKPLILIQGLSTRSIKGAAFSVARSEERRVGKECRSRWSPYH